jgi:hypothetical protein
MISARIEMRVLRGSFVPSAIAGGNRVLSAA